MPALEAAPAAIVRPSWPSTAVAQLQGLTGLLAAEALTQEEVIQRFEGVKASVVQRHLDTLVLLGELSVADGRYFAPTGGASAADAGAGLGMAR